MVCPQCDENLTEKEIVDKINSNRLVDTKFPDSGQIDPDEYIDSFSMEYIRELNELIDSISEDVSKFVVLDAQGREGH
jgi:hypothetical protein